MTDSDARPGRAIVGFHQDELGDWVAELECGHTQHVRHRPPWINRPWATTAAGRQRFLGVPLPCRDCLYGTPPGAGAGPGDRGD